MVTINTTKYVPYCRLSKGKGGHKVEPFYFKQFSIIKKGYASIIVSMTYVTIMKYDVCYDYEVMFILSSFRCFKFNRRLPVGRCVSFDLRPFICMAYCHFLCVTSCFCWQKSNGMRRAPPQDGLPLCFIYFTRLYIYILLLYIFNIDIAMYIFLHTTALVAILLGSDKMFSKDKVAR